jgi:sortase A
VTVYRVKVTVRVKRLNYLYFLVLLSLALTACGRSAEGATNQAPPLRIHAPQLSHPLLRPMLPDRLVIPAIQLDTTVVELGWSAKQDQEGQVFGEWDVADFAAGWHKNSVRLGEQGNVVLSGHNNILGAVFRELDQLKQGDKATIYAGGIRFTYDIDEVMIVPEKYAKPEQRKENARWIGPFPDNRLTLVSCWPRDNNTHRIIVIAHLENP